MSKITVPFFEKSEPNSRHIARQTIINIMKEVPAKCPENLEETTNNFWKALKNKQYSNITS